MSSELQAVLENFLSRKLVSIFKGWDVSSYCFFPLAKLTIEKIFQTALRILASPAIPKLNCMISLAYCMVLKTLRVVELVYRMWNTIWLSDFNEILLMFVNSAIFYGLSIYAVNIGGNKYLNFILVSIVEIPACIVFYFLVNRGRKLALILGLVVSAAACLTFHFIPQDSTMSFITYFIGKLAISGSSTAICILASETFPTDFRNTLFGFASTVAVIGTIVAPQVPLIAKYVDPLLIFGGMAISASVLGLFFPETRNCAMPDSLKEAEDMGKK